MNGHLSERVTKTRQCVECQREHVRRPESKARMREHNRKRRLDPKFLELERRVRNTDKAKARKAEYNKRPEMKAWRSQWQKERVSKDPVYAMRRRFGTLLNIKIKNMGYTKKSKAVDILGCDWDFFKSHIERQFLEGMTWENRGAWHIDHIVPAATAKTEEELLALCHFTNLRPMWAKENISKGDSRTHLL